jgi:hypothetical protein
MNKVGSKSTKIVSLVGYLGVAIVVVSSAGYSVQVTFSPTAADRLLALTFCAINVLAWAGGYYARRREPLKPFGTTLLVLGDALFPLNLYAPAYLYLSPLKGNVALSISAVLLVGIVYHLRGFFRANLRRFSPVFYPYFFTGSIGGILCLTRFTIGLSVAIVVWIIVAFAVAFQTVAASRNLQPRRHFSFATLALLLVIMTFTVDAFLAANAGQYLPAFFILAATVGWLARTTRNLGSPSRLFGLGFFIALTVSFTAVLYHLNASAAVYVIFTTLWVCTLSALPVVLKNRKMYPFRESADWLSIILGLSLVAYFVPFWSLLLKYQIIVPLTHALRLPAGLRIEQPEWVLPPLSLIAISAAFLVGSYRKRRYPTISASKAGLMTNIAVISLMSYLPLLFLVAAGTGLGLALSGEVLGATIAPFVVGVAYLIASQGSDRLYPMRTLKLAGYIAIMLSVLASVYSVDVAAIALLCSSLVFFWRSGVERHLWLHLCFLTLITSAAAIFAVRVPDRDDMYILSLLSVGLVGVYRWQRSQQSRDYEAQLTLIWAFVLALATVAVESAWGRFAPYVFLPIWIGFLVLLGGDSVTDAWKNDRPAIDRNVVSRFKRLRSTGYWVGHLSGAAFIISLVVKSGRPVSYAALALAIWALLQFSWCNLGSTRSSSRLAVDSARKALNSFALISLLLAGFFGDGAFYAISAAFGISALYLLMRLSWKRTLFEDAAALSLIEAFYLLGVKLVILLPEYYVSLFGLYLCFLVWRNFRRSQVAPRPVRAMPLTVGWRRHFLNFLGKNPLSIAIVAMLVVFPLWKFVGSLDNAHIYYLGGATVGIIYLFLWTRQQAVLVYLVGALFVQAAVCLLTFGRSNETVNLFFVLVGSLIIASQMFPKGWIETGAQPTPKLT